MADKDLTLEEARERIKHVDGGVLPPPNATDYNNWLYEAKFKQCIELITLRVIIRIIIYLLVLVSAGAIVAKQYL